VVDAIVAQAEAMLADDVSANRAIGEHGSEAIIGAAAGNGQLRVLTHCNAGASAVTFVRTNDRGFLLTEAIPAF
jgi:methylthioribose-1-phosphate isomerase